MELGEFLKIELERLQGGINRATNDLTPAELKWQPNPEGNPIGFLLYHMARTEDRFVQRSLQEKPPIWESEKWYEKLNIPQSDTGGFGYTAETVAAFVVPELQNLQAYAEAVRAKTLDYLGGMTPDKFDKVINVPPFGELTVGALWVVIIGHNTQHAGEISYLRGLQKGINK